MHIMLFNLCIILAGIFTSTFFYAANTPSYFSYSEVNNKDTVTKQHPIPHDILINHSPKTPITFTLDTYHDYHNHDSNMYHLRCGMTHEEKKLETDAFLLSLHHLTCFPEILKFIAHVVDNKLKRNPDIIVALCTSDQDQDFMKLLIGTSSIPDHKTKLPILKNKSFKDRFISALFDMWRETDVMPLCLPVESSDDDSKMIETKQKELKQSAFAQEITYEVVTVAHQTLKSNTCISCYLQPMQNKSYALIVPNLQAHMLNATEKKEIFITKQKIRFIASQEIEIRTQNQNGGYDISDSCIYRMLTYNIPAANSYILQVTPYLMKKETDFINNPHKRYPEETIATYNKAFSDLNKHTRELVLYGNHDDLFMHVFTEIPIEQGYGWNTTKIMLKRLCTGFNAQCLLAYCAAPWCIQKLTGFHTSPCMLTGFNTLNYIFFQYQPKYPEGHNFLSRAKHYFNPVMQRTLTGKLAALGFTVLWVSSPCVTSYFFPSAVPIACAVSFVFRFLNTFRTYAPFYNQPKLVPLGRTCGTRTPPTTITATVYSITNEGTDALNT